MAEVVYILCAATSIVCALLLFRGYRRSRTAAVLEQPVFRRSRAQQCLAVRRSGRRSEHRFVPRAEPAALIALGLLLFGLVWDSR